MCNLGRNCLRVAHCRAPAANLACGGGSLPRSPAPRPQPGPGLGFHSPAWAVSGPMALGRSSRSDGCPSFSTDQKARGRLSPETLTHFRLRAGPLASARVRPRVSAPPLSGLAAVLRARAHSTRLRITSRTTAVMERRRASMSQFLPARRRYS